MQQAPDWQAVPMRSVRLWQEALGGWFELLRDAAIDPLRIVGARSAAGIVARWPQLADLMQAGWLRQETWSDAATLDGASAWAANGRDKAEWVDRWLVPELMWGLCRSVGPQQDSDVARAVATLLAVDSYRPIVDPLLSPDALLDGPGCHVRPHWAAWLAAGRSLAVEHGLEPLLAAYVDQARPQLSWQDVVASAILPAPAAQAAATEPLASVSGGLDEQEAAWIEDMVLACLWRRRLQQRDGGGQATRATLWRDGAVHIDLLKGVLRTQGGGGLVRSAEGGWVDAGLPPLPLPPRPCALARRAGWAQATLQWQAPDDTDELIDTVFALLAGELEPIEVEGEGFVLRP